MMASEATSEAEGVKYLIENLGPKTSEALKEAAVSTGQHMALLSLSTMFRCKKPYEDDHALTRLAKWVLSGIEDVEQNGADMVRMEQPTVHGFAASVGAFIEPEVIDVIWGDSMVDYMRRVRVQMDKLRKIAEQIRKADLNGDGGK